MSDPWIEAIKIIEPRIEELLESMKQGPIIKPSLVMRGKRWNIVLEEAWPSVDDAGNYYHSSGLDDRVEWAVVELKKWDTTRTAWDTWQFNSRKDAEKFITFYNLTWA